MGLYIRDPKVHALAKELAARRRTTVTDIVRTALEHEQERDDAKRDAKIRRTLEIVEHFRSLPELRPGFTDKDLYDEEGNPVL